jgi:hypothetical protein
MAALEINSALLRERIPTITLGASGVVGTAAATVDIVSNIGVTASAAGLTFTLPNPTDTRSGLSTVVMNTGANIFSMYANSVKPSQYIELIWGIEDLSWHSPSVPQESAADFWRSGSLAGITPDGATDTQDAIFRSGQTVVDTGTVADSGLTLDDLRATHANISYMSSMVENQNTAIGVNNAGKVVLANGVGVPDVRATNLNPQDYAAGVSQAFKQTSAIGMTGITGLQTYVNLTTTRRYATTTDFSGGPVRQDVDLDDGRQYFRVSTGATTWGPWLLEASGRARNLQERFTSQATTKISLAGEVRWDGFYHVMTRGTNSVEPNGHFRIDMPADAFAVPVAGGGTRAVVPAVAGSSVDTGGILLNTWDSLYYKHPVGQSAGSVPANFLIVPYLANTQANSVFTEADDWIMVARRGDASEFTLGTGDVTGIGGQVGRGGFISTANWQAMKQRVMGDGYFFVPAGNSAFNLAFGFTGTIRWIDGGSTPGVNSTGYVDAGQADKLVGKAIRGVNGAANRAWRLMTAAEKPGWFGGAQRGTNPILAASTTVVDLNDNETLYYVRNMNGAAGQGEWVVAGYSGLVSTPIHWLPIASKQTTGGHSTTQLLLGGVQYALKAGDARYTSTNDAAIDAIRKTQNITHKGLKYCRFALATQFAGAGANGLLSSAFGIYSSWDDNTLIYGISDGYSNFGNQYTWLNPPTNGYQIPAVSTNSNVTRTVKTIGGRRYIPLGVWEALFWIPPAYTGGTTSVDGDWVISYYGSGNQHLPPSAVMVLKYAGAVSSASGIGPAKTRIKFADGTYMQPGYTYPPSLATEFEYDMAQGSGDWRAITVAGGTVAARTSPGMTAPMTAVAGVIGNYGAPYSAFFRYLPNDSDPRGQIEIEGLISLDGDVANGSVIAFLPGVFVRGNPIQMAQLTASTFADAKNIPVQIRYSNATINGQSGTQVVAQSGFIGASNPYRTLGANGGASAAGVNQWVSLGPLTLPHA